MTARLGFTGERFVPGAAGEIWYEHWHRYYFATHLVAEKRVLDVACGEGYGSALLARAGARVVGVDRSIEAIAHAREVYGGTPNLAFATGDCAALPLADAQFDLVVSFETLEHIGAQDAFLAEVRRVLRPEGTLVLSSPNKREYSDRRDLANPFHVGELYRDELASLLAAHFSNVVWYGQQPSFFSVIWPESGRAEGEIFEIAETAPLDRSRGHARPLYFLALASRSPATLTEIVPRLSVLADRDEWVHRDYEKVTAELRAAHERGNALEAGLTACQEHHAEAVRQRDALEVAHAEAVAQRDALAAERAEAIRDQKLLEAKLTSEQVASARSRENAAALSATVAARDASLAAAEAWRLKLEADIADLRAEVARRETLGGVARALLARLSPRRRRAGPP